MADEKPLGQPCNGCKDCPCPGRYSAQIQGLGPIAPYHGEFPSPLHVTWYAPANVGELFELHIPASRIRGWLVQASDYHGVPVELAAVILQQENGPNATTTQKVLQFGERSLTTFAAIVDDALFDVVPDKISGGSSGIANLSRKTLRDAAAYIEKTYCRPVIPDDVRRRLLGLSQDTRIPGDDLRADLYYLTAHLRQLIDRVTGKICHDGPLTLEQVQKVAAAYNGSGPLAVKYGQDALARLRSAEAGTVPLYFYEE